MSKRALADLGDTLSTYNLIHIKLPFHGTSNVRIKSN